MAFTNKIAAAFTHDVTNDLGQYVMPHLIEWWKVVRAEHDYHYKQIAELKALIRQADKAIAPAKKRDGPQSIVTKRLIQHRRSSHENVKPLEDKIYLLRRHLASFDKIFNAAIEPYSRASSLALTSALYAKCPRELRDMVYSHLLEGATLSDQFAKQVWLPYESVDYSFPIFLNPEYVYEEVVSEMMHILAKRFTPTRSKLRAFFTTSDVELEFAASEFFRHLREATFPNTVFATPPLRSDAEKMRAAEELYGRYCRGGMLKPTCRFVTKVAKREEVEW
ncbi:uncharacterized protein N0V89_006364 [Didymosphaeria variabile]|uniref:Uncharacterized protein n=1 Tax=Didymosphaeria variabile TaxID=1932322 RepID=A0A9W8XME2_9PLEO|nr:uncharacterized protein N0V89_006364 [Didymosphaeria variabile]KAJ4354627.1 hypothetical protein N0V89_006364 [Didymosphaeria variabile]